MTKFMIRFIQTIVISVMALMSLNAAAVERVTYYHNDALGSPVAATDNDGNLLWREEYEPYGERILREDSGTNNLWYTGKQEEEAFGINYFGARWYDPGVGRFMAIDSIGFDDDNIHSFNRYAYANNNPYLYVDPNGDFAIIGGLLAVAAIVGAGYTGFDLGTTAYNLHSGQVTLGSALKSAAFDAGIGIVSGGLGKLALKFLPGSVKDKVKDLVANNGDSDQPDLQRIHSDETLNSGSNKFDLESQRSRSTEDIVNSLAPGSPEPLKVKADGRIFDGNTRVKVLEERGVDVNKLPRTNIE